MWEAIWGCRRRFGAHTSGSRCPSLSRGRAVPRGRSGPSPGGLQLRSSSPVTAKHAPFSTPLFARSTEISPQKTPSHLPGMWVMLLGTHTRVVHPEVHPKVIPACSPDSFLQDFGHDRGDQAHPGDRWHRLGGQSHREGGGRWRGAAGRGVDLRVLPRCRLDVSWVFP